MEEDIYHPLSKLKLAIAEVLDKTNILLQRPDHKGKNIFLFGNAITRYVFKMPIPIVKMSIFVKFTSNKTKKCPRRD